MLSISPYNPTFGSFLTRLSPCSISSLVVVSSSSHPCCLDSLACSGVSSTMPLSILSQYVSVSTTMFPSESKLMRSISFSQCYLAYTARESIDNFAMKVRCPQGTDGHRGSNLQCCKELTRVVT